MWGCDIFWWCMKNKPFNLDLINVQSCHFNVGLHMNDMRQTHESKANRYYKVRFYPLCINCSYNYPWSSDWSRVLSPKEKIIWMYPRNISNLFLFNKHLVFCFESWEILIVLLVVSYERSHQNFRKCQIWQILKSVFRLV